MTVEQESCGTCGKKLTTVKSKAVGYGAVCYAKLQVERARQDGEKVDKETDSVHD